MKRNPLNCTAPALGIVFLLAVFLGPAFGEKVPAPEILIKRNIAKKTEAVDLVNTFLGIPYRDDGTLDQRGVFTTFSRPDEVFDEPGLNCSGLVVSAARYLLNKNFTISEVKRDRQGNSGPNSPLGEDWDFGWDLILNLTEGIPRQVIMPDGKPRQVERIDARLTRGFDLQDRQAWVAMLGQMQPGRIYPGSISRPTKRVAAGVLHYHVVLIVPDRNGSIWLYHATRRSQVHKMDIRTARGLNRLLGQFGGTRGEQKQIILVEGVLQGTDVGEPIAADAGPGSRDQASTKAAGDESGADKALAILGGIGVPPSNNAPDPERSDSRAAEHQPPDSQATRPTEPPASAEPRGPETVISHSAGKVFQRHPDLMTQIPRFADAAGNSLRFWYANRGEESHKLDVVIKGPGGDASFGGNLPAGSHMFLIYPNDFKGPSGGALAHGRYSLYVSIDGKRWSTDIFEVGQAKEAAPQIVDVKVPSTVRPGATFTVEVKARNQGAESDYGGITLSAPNPNGLQIVAATPGRVYQRGSTVLSITSDRVKTKVPMAERWIELWGEEKVYDMSVKLKAGSPGEYPLYVRCALRGVNVKSSVIL
ncbi:MAG: hypothetical protein V2B18_23610, partial [Pseudomonadota bacterium]